MTRFDSLTPAGIYAPIDHNWIRPSYIEYAIETKYSKEFRYLQEVRNYTKGWDSYDGKPPNKQSIIHSVYFLSSFTNELRKSNIVSHFPEFCLAPDGILGFEWDYAENAHLFARIYSADKIEYTLKENNCEQPPKEIKNEDFIEMCKEKLYQYNQVA